jgi:hypothetical protein
VLAVVVLAGLPLVATPTTAAAALDDVAADRLRPSAARAEALQALARASAALARGALDEADVLLRAAEPELATSAAWRLTAARWALAAGRPERARGVAAAARAADADDDEAIELEARAAVALDRLDDARALLVGREGLDLELLAAALGDDGAAARAARWVDEPTERGALTALVLASSAARAGRRSSAGALATSAEALARRVGDVEVGRAARALLERTTGPDVELLRLGGRVASFVEATTNPALTPTTRALETTTLRGGLAGELSLQAPIGPVRLDAALAIDQRVVLADRAAFAGQDLTGLGAAVGLEIPISLRADAATVGLAARFTDLFGDAFRLHYASAIEGGPTLSLPVGARTRASITLLAVGVDVIDFSPPDAQISSQNRDAVGQRAIAALEHRVDDASFRVEAAFVRDDAYGEAFDVRGAVLGARASWLLSGGLRVRAAASGSARSFGPVGDALVIGAAATRTEGRLGLSLGLEVPASAVLGPWAGAGEGTFAFLEDRFVHTFAREGHAYAFNVLSVGVEQRW